MNNLVKVHEPMKGITGEYKIKRYRRGTVDLVRPILEQATRFKKRSQWLQHTMFARIAKRWQRKSIELEEKAERLLQANFLGLAVEGDNLVVTSTDHGRNLICQRLAGENSYSLNITHIEIGTDNTTPANGDTDLGAGTERGAVTTYTIVNNVLTLRFFLSDAEVVDDTYNEMGTFIDGTASLGTGQMWNHALFASPYVKATGEDTTIELVITVN